MTIRCPHCEKELVFSYRKGLIFNEAICCVFCRKPVKVRSRNQILNSAAIGVFVSGVLTLLTNLEIEAISIIAVILAIFFQGFLDVFYSLEPAEVEDLL